MKNKKMNIFVKHLLIAAGVLVVLVIAVLLALNSYTHHGEEEVVPNVKNMSIEKAANILKHLAHDTPHIIIKVGVMKCHTPFIRCGRHGTHHQDFGISKKEVTKRMGFDTRVSQ